MFNFDSPLMQFLTKVADLIILNLLFLVTSVPVITIGASATALHYVALRMIHGQEGPITRDYFRSFRTNFRQATAIWLLLLGFALILQYDIRSVWSGTGAFHTAVKVLSVVACVALVMILLYVFAILARFDNTVRGTLKNAAALALRNFPKTLTLFMLPFAAVALTLYTETTLRWGMLFWLVGGFSFVAYFNSLLLDGIFRKLIPGGDQPEEPEEDEEDPDDLEEEY